uniref:Senescence-associated protein n=1 Tax=Xenopus tropicalis TaxID=8364 RepID=A0A803K0S6_XENTR
MVWVNNPTLGEFCFTMIGRADIEGSKSDVAMNAWPPQASYPCGNFSDTSCLKPKNYGSDLPTSLTYIVLTCQRLFTLETCCGYGYGPARDLHPLPRIFKGQRELTGRRRNRDAFQGAGPSLGANPFQGGPALHKEKRTLPGAPAGFSGIGRVAALDAPAPPTGEVGGAAGARLRHSGFGDLNPTPFRSAEGDGGHRPSLPNGARPSLRTD